MTDFLNYVRREQCLMHFKDAEPHHLDAVGMGRNRKREMIEHLTVVPLCRICHMELHTIGLGRLSGPSWGKPMAGEL